MTREDTTFSGSGRELRTPEKSPVKFDTVGIGAVIAALADGELGESAREARALIGIRTTAISRLRSRLRSRSCTRRIAEAHSCPQ